MANKWLVHVKKTMKQMKSKGTYKKGMGLKQVIMAAKKTWHSAKKSMTGGESDSDKKAASGTGDGFKKDETPVVLPPAPEGGRRRTRRRHRNRRR